MNSKINAGLKINVCCTQLNQESTLKHNQAKREEYKTTDGIDTHAIQVGFSLILPAVTLRIKIVSTAQENKWKIAQIAAKSCNKIIQAFGLSDQILTGS